MNESYQVENSSSGASSYLQTVHELFIVVAGQSQVLNHHTDNTREVLE